MYKILVIGCGNIGAQYDFNNDDVQTHVKAWSLKDNTSLTVFDLDKELMYNVANHYNCKTVEEVTVRTLSDFDIVSLCSPTNTHFNLLKKLIKANVKTVICEKPISYKKNEIVNIIELYNNSSTKIIVNYIRRFQPDYLKLKDRIKKITKQESITNISLRYQRGFINNCSHALDLLEFLMDSSFHLKNINTHNFSYDEFKTDPTLTLSAFWGKINISILGLSKVSFSLFEIDIFFQTQKISISESGNRIQFFKSKKEQNFYGPLLITETLKGGDSIKNYMLSVVNQAIKITENPLLIDNFMQSANLNIKLLNYIKNQK